MRNLLLLVVLTSIVSATAGCWLSSDDSKAKANIKTPGKALSEQRSRNSPKPSSVSSTAREARVAGQKEPRASDPRFTYDGMFRNIKPAVKYVGDENCAQCHAEICNTFHQHPMGRSAILAGSDTLEQYDTEAMNPFRVGSYELSVENHSNGMKHRVGVNLPSGEENPSLEIPVSVAIGSGTRGRSYLTIDGDTVWQSPISWFSTNSRWDVSPGFDIGQSVQRPIVTECLFCHANQHDAIDGSFNRYHDPINSLQLAIGCERCHGPGELHARERAAVPTQVADGQIDTSIVNPAHLSESLQMAICAQCHLSGKERVLRRGRAFSEFRPGLPIEQFITAFFAHPDAPFRNTAVSHFDQSALSKCRSAAGTPLTCTACHDPHRVPADEDVVSYYNATCIACHETQMCSATASVRQAKSDNCIACHMPTDASSNIPHTSFTDHRILRQPDRLDPSKPFESTEVPLIPYGDTSLLSAPELERDLGIALSRFADRQPAASPFRKNALLKARERLMISLQRWPDDIPAWLALGNVELISGNIEQAVRAAQEALRAGPDREDVQSMVAIIADATGTYEFSVRALDPLVRMVPESQDYLAKRMRASVAAAEWKRAEKYCNALLKINPVHPSARVVLAMILYGDGKKAEGLAEFETAKHLATTQQQRDSFQTWFDRFVAYRSQFK